MTDLVLEIWRAIAGGLRLSTERLTWAAAAGGISYAAGYLGILKLRKRWADPLTGRGLLGVLGLSQGEKTMRGEVTTVYDGDTIEVGGERTIRILGIDAPEKSQSDKLLRDARKTGMDPAEIIKQGERAQRWLESVIGGEMVELELDESTDTEDKYGRTLAHVWSVDEQGRTGYLLSEMIVWRGHACPMGESHKYERRLEEAWEQARKEGVGGGIGVPGARDRKSYDEGVAERYLK